MQIKSQSQGFPHNLEKTNVHKPLACGNMITD